VIDKNTPELVEQSKQLLHRLNSASDSMNDVLKPQNRAAIAATLGNVQTLSHDLLATQNQLKDALEQLDSMLRENRPGVRDAVADLRATLSALSARIDSITQHLAIASRNFDEFSHEIRKHPNALLVSPKADKVEGQEQ
jgi:phospholipid/cholesterol/gamma-HCH transport system substrate-binding protein